MHEIYHVIYKTSNDKSSMTFIVFCPICRYTCDIKMLELWHCPRGIRYMYEYCHSISRTRRVCRWHLQVKSKIYVLFKCLYSSNCHQGCSGCKRMVVVSSSPDHDEVYPIQHYVIVCHILTAGQDFPLGTPVSFTNKTYRHDIAEILLKMAINTITLTHWTLT